MKRQAWITAIDMDKLSKFANVFDRLKEDSKLWLLQKIKEDPREASKLANSKSSY